jgi:NodT family efflux transporter outer membrane factor (OMF) lipoprotein
MLPSRMLALACALLAAGCTVGPDYTRPALPLPDRYTPERDRERPQAAAGDATNAQRFVIGGEVPARWWDLFGSPPLSALVDEALRNNPDVVAAQSALRQAQEIAAAQRGPLYPQVQASLNAARARNSDTIAAPLSSGASVYNLYTPQVAVTYLLDTWGGVRRQVESQQASAQAQQHQLEATYLALTANVVVAAIQEASIRAQLAAVDRIVELQTQQVALYRRQLELGAIPGADVAAQQAALAQSQALRPPLAKQLAVQQSLLARLCGRMPSEATPAFELASLVLPDELPVSLPSTLVERRPDVRAAEDNVRAASAQVGVAIANMLPQVTLTASAGAASEQWSNLLTPGNVAWSIGAGILQPLFMGGALRHRREAAEAGFAQAAAQYRAAVLTAFQNVADALRAVQVDAQAVDANLRAREAAAQSLAITQRAVSLGASSYVALISAEQAFQQTELALAQSRASRYSDAVALFQALGGGWWPATTTGSTGSPRA